ncbi:MAG: hypothetical protein PWP43_1329 [Bacillota bacterium]|nr:hypothetical protein [Bacillota bacterium]
MASKHRLGTALVATLLVLVLIAPPALADCTTVLVGSKATIDGSLLVGHNEDNGGRIVMPQYYVPRMKHEPGEVIRFENGGTTPQVPETWAFLWSQTPGGSFSDFFVNEWGVVVCSDNCGPTREDTYEDLVARGDITDGGIGYHIRRIVAERARTAREGVEIAAKLVEEFGYIAPGRSYHIADGKEAWVLHLVRGKHYAAQRVPDDMAVVIPNHYVIREVNLKDKKNFIASPDIIDYAIERGWYDPKSGKPFDFAEAYSAPAQGKALERGYDTRQWIGQKLLTGKTPEGPLPFAVKPAEKVGVRDVMNILRNHYEGTPYDKTDGYETSPHWTDERVICTSTTRESSVTQLRDNVPAALKAVYWRTSGRPDTSPYVPWYLGITAVPEGHFWAEPTVGSSLQFKPHAALYDYDRTKAWWTFQDLENIVDAQYGSVIGKVQKTWQNFEEEALAKQAEVEKEACRLLAKDEAAGRAYLTQYTNSLAQKAWQQAKELIGELPTMKVDIPREAVRLSETGTLQVNIISSGELSAKNIDPATLTLGPAYRNPNTWVPAKSSALKDVNGDGDPDLTLTFELPPLLKLISPACYTDLWLHGSTKAGAPIVGRDLVNFLE